MGRTSTEGGAGLRPPSHEVWRACQTAPMQHRIPHKLSAPLARLVTRKALDSYVQRYPEFKPTGRWTSPDRAEFQLSALGAKVNGVIVVAAGSVDLDIDVPLIIEPFRKKVTAMVDEEVSLWLKWAAEGRFDAEVPAEARARRA